MPREASDYVEEAAECWRRGQALEAGRLIFENLSPEERPIWAAKILRLAVERTTVRHPSIQRLIGIAENTGEWVDGHRVFDALRDSTLKLERLPLRSPQQELLRHLLLLAENVAKVIYNATNPRDEFDADSGWWILPCLRTVVDSLHDEEFARAAWAELCDSVRGGESA